MLNRNNFYEPTNTYAEDFGGFPLELIRDWYNVDLIFIAKKYPSEKDSDMFVLFYNNFTTEFGINLTVEEIYENFKDYSVDDFNSMMKYIIEESKQYDRG